MHTVGSGVSFEKFGHKNAIKHEDFRHPHPYIFWQSQVHPLNEFFLNPKDPLWISNYCESMSLVLLKLLVNVFFTFFIIESQSLDKNVKCCLRNNNKQ
jgi:hypothetical protein